MLKTLVKRYLAWRDKNAREYLNRSLRYQGGFVSWIPAIVSVASSVIGSDASGDAADVQANAANKASDQQLQMFNTINDQQAPWRQAGATALSQLGGLTGPGGSALHQFDANDLKSNLAPNYQFQLDQGIGATKNLANSTGGLISGNALKGINDYAQNYAGNAYQQAFNNYNAGQTNIFNRLSSIAGLGQTANQTTANAGQTAATASGNYLTGGAAAQAAGLVGGASAITQGANNAMGWNYLSSLNKGNAAPAATQGYGSWAASDNPNEFGG